MNKEHKYKDKDEYKDNDKDKDAERITESLTVCYIFGILVTQAFQVWWWIPPPSQPHHPRKRKGKFKKLNFQANKSDVASILYSGSPGPTSREKNIKKSSIGIK